MGKGKKKGGKEPSLETLSLSEDQPSTSQSAPAVAPLPEPLPTKDEEDEGGLGLPGKKRNRKKKPKADVPATIAEPVKSQEVTAPVAVSTPPSLIQVAPTVPMAPAGRGRGRGFGRGSTPNIPGQPTNFPQMPQTSSWKSPIQAPIPTQQMAPPVPQMAAQLKPIPTQPAAQVPPVKPETIAPAQSSSSPSTEIVHFKIPNKRPNPSKWVLKKSLTVLTNYLTMTIEPFKVYRYDISFKPDKPKKMIPKAYSEVKNKHFPRHLIAFDQMKNCYTLKPLPVVSGSDRFMTTAEVLDANGKVMKFEISIKATGIVDLSTIFSYMESGTSLNTPTEAIQCIDVILRQGTLETYVKAGRQFFRRPSNPIDLGDGLEMWTGLFQSAIFTSRPFINVDVAHKGFPRNQPMITAIQNDFGLELHKPIDQQRRHIVENFLMFIKGLRVIARIGGDQTANAQRREFICNGLAKPPGQITFTMTDEKGKSRPMTVLEYFVKEKKCRIKYPNLNCMWVGPKDKQIHYPMELLEISYGQALNKQLNERQLSTMVRTAAAPPEERKRKIQEVIKNMNYSRNKYFKDFGLDISDDFYEVEAKLLKPPTLSVGRADQFADPINGVWQQNRLYKPGALTSWAFIAIELDPRACDYENMKNLTLKVARDMGMPVEEPRMTQFNRRIEDLHKLLADAQSRDINFVFVIVPGRLRDVYHRVKQIAERNVGILTQCIKDFTASRRMNLATMKNILLKVNSKLMGVNQVIEPRSIPMCLRDAPVMLVGADVTHPSPDQVSVPSIAAVTASLDPNFFQYHIALSIQTPKKEMIVEFEEMMSEHLSVFKQRNKILPRKIFVFRDGVSEGQFSQVMNSELKAVHAAYATHAGPGVKPEVLFLLVQKRHHTRFFTKGPTAANVTAGTVVDKHIVHARELDFYLVSHQAIKGTARPTRYHAVCNDGGIPDEEVQQLTYYLCHLYSRCTRAVSYPTPTYYAHLACLRARSLTFGEKFSNVDLEKNPKRLRVLDKILDTSRMFFV